MQGNNNPLTLGTESVKKLLLRYAIPSIVAMLSSSLYNMIDSIFIGHGVGGYGNIGLSNNNADNERDSRVGYAG